MNLILHSQNIVNVLIYLNNFFLQGRLTITQISKAFLYYCIWKNVIKLSQESEFYAFQIFQVFAKNLIHL